jgi:hypothetical protein
VGISTSRKLTAPTDQQFSLQNKKINIRGGSKWRSIRVACHW